MGSSFKQTGTILDRILAHKQEEIAARKKIVSESEMRAQADNSTRPRNSLYAALRQRETIGLIAEIKHASPSKGAFVENFDPLEFATTYIDNGAAAISILTDEQFFQGHLEHLSTIGTETDFKVPLLRKDFIIDPYQIQETVAACADATLLIVAALEDIQLAELYSEMKMWSA